MQDVLRGVLTSDLWFNLDERMGRAPCPEIFPAPVRKHAACQPATGAEGAFRLPRAEILFDKRKHLATVHFAAGHGNSFCAQRSSFTSHVGKMYFTERIPVETGPAMYIAERA